MALPTASTQYNDMKGTAAVDWHSATELKAFAASKKIDTKRYFPLGFGFSGVPPTQFVIYAVDTRLIEPDFDKIYKYAEAQDGTVPIVEFHFTSSLEEASKFLKRLDVVVHTQMASLKEFHSVETIQLD